MIEVTLTWPECQLAAFVGSQRQTENIEAGRTNSYGCDPDDGWTPHIEGAAGEMAVAKAFNLFWSGNLRRLQADDVGRLQVRRGAGHYYDLRLHERDPDDRKFVCVTGKMPYFRIHGWIEARDGKQMEFWHDKYQPGRPAFWVPQRLLKDVNLLHPRET
jgi:hypothetical protein